MKKTGDNRTNKEVDNFLDQKHIPFLKKLPHWLKFVICIFIIIFILVIIGGNQILDFYSKLKDVRQARQSSELGKEENKPKFSNFHDGKWTEYLGTFSRNNEINYFGLASTNNKALLKFDKQFSERELIIFEFVPLSLASANVVIHVNDLYEIVVGDDDYKTLTFKARDGWKGPWRTVPDKQGDFKKELYTGIKRGTNVVLRIITYCQMDGNYFVKIEIKFKPEKFKKEEDQILNAEYIFNPPFQECMPLDIGVGLLNPDFQSDISAKFISFEII